MFDSFEDINYLFFFTPQLFCLLEINEKNVITLKISPK